MKELLSFARCGLIQMLMPAQTLCEGQVRRIDGQRGRRSREAGGASTLLGPRRHVPLFGLLVPSGGRPQTQPGNVPAHAVCCLCVGRGWT
jgi:hypothetical protein